MVHSFQKQGHGLWLYVLALALYRMAVFELPVILLKEPIKILGLVRQN